MMETILGYIQSLASSTFAVALEAAPWLLIGVVVAGVVRAWLPERAVARWLGGSGAGPVFKAALIGTPLPLCSCGVVPAALGLRRSGASEPATVSFLVATPQNGADSIALSYALLGPVFAIARPVAALVCAISAGLATLCTVRRAHNSTAESPADVVLPVAQSCCCSTAATPAAPPPPAPSCCASSAPAPAPSASMMLRLQEGMDYAFGKLLDDIAKWLIVGIVVSGAMVAFVPAGALASLGSGPLAMVAMALIGVPMYVCATAATPVAAGLVAVGVSPGAALVLLLAGPATNLGTLGIVRKELGTPAALAYLFGVVVLAIVCGWGLDALLAWQGWSVAATIDARGGGHIVPGWLAAGSLGVLVVFMVRPVRERLLGAIGRVDARAQPAQA